MIWLFRLLAGKAEFFDLHLWVGWLKKGDVVSSLDGTKIVINARTVGKPHTTGTPYTYQVYLESAYQDFKKYTWATIGFIVLFLIFAILTEI